MLTQVTCTFKLESLRPIPDTEITARLHELLLNEDSETDNFMGQDCAHYALLMTDIEVKADEI